MGRIAVLIASHNRKAKTLACLSSLYACSIPGSISLDTYLADDGSADGTACEVKNAFPLVEVIQGNGSLYWAGGMRLAWNTALKKGYDWYLLLNDDTNLYSRSICMLLETHDHSVTAYGKAGICVGTTLDPVTAGYSYGGQKITNAVSGRSTIIIPQAGKFQDCDFANGNILLVSDEVVKKTGILSERYTHLLADFDYTLTASKMGIPVVVAPGYCGECENDHRKTWLSADHPFRDRVRYLKDPKHLAFREYMYFVRRHFPLYLPVSFAKLWGKTLLPSLWDRHKQLS